MILSNIQLQDIINLSNEVSRLADEKRQKIPYQFNLIDELRASENAHSRILIRLLGYRDFGTYPFLQSFLKWLGSDFELLEIRKPIFTAERERIDALVTEPCSYGLIIENKVHGALDQDRQIERYVKKMKKSLSYDQIFVLYLTKSGGSPTESSMTQEIRENIGSRYL